MRIAAIYITEHEYLFDKPQTLNFGGEYFYRFQRSGKDVLITREKNKTFINKMFDLTNLDTQLLNINAVVGQNGSGKTSILDIVRSGFIEHRAALPHANYLIIFETNKSDKPLIIRNDFKDIYLGEPDANGTTLKTKLANQGFAESKKFQTIYYSPHYDYKYNSNYDNIDSHDISFDKTIEEDLANLNDKETNDQGWAYTPSQELLFKNSMRQIEFLSSDLVKRQNIFKDIFHLQEHYEPILFFRGYTIKDRNWNTPEQFRGVLRLIEDKIESEQKKWHTIRKHKGGKILNQADVNKYLLKRNVLRTVITLLYKQMERQNSFLNEGLFPYDKLKTELKEQDAYNSFILFIDNCAIKLSTDSSEKVFNKPYLKQLLAKIYQAIEAADNEDNVTKTSLMTSKENAVEIMKLQRGFLSELNVYYNKFYSNTDEPTIPDGERIEEFVNYMPFTRRLSSGENALLNLFSRIYSFFNNNLKDNKFRQLKEHYILLLDEADLSFHPSWKKRYVKALVNTIPYLFNELENRPTVQIIFTTHDPLTLSDLPNTNVIYIERRSYEDKPKVLDYNDFNRPLKTFGANISDLLADSFFVEQSLIGDFAYDKIHKTIEWLNNKKIKKNADYHRKLIKMIDEPIVQRKLAEMYDDKMTSNFQIEVINDQIRKLEEVKNNLES